MTTLALINQKGGVGKTTCAVNIAAELALSGAPTLLVDLDPQANATSALGMTGQAESGTTYDLLMSDRSLSSLARPTKVAGLDLVPASQELAGAEVELQETEGRYVRLARALSTHHYSYVIIDCPPALGFLSLNALVAAKYALIPVQSEYLALEGLTNLLGIVKKVQGELNPDLELLGIVLTMYDQRIRLSTEVAGQLRSHFSDQLFPTPIPRTVRLAEATSFGEPIGAFDRSSKGAAAFHQLTKEVANAIEARTRQRA